MGEVFFSPISGSVRDSESGGHTEDHRGKTMVKRKAMLKQVEKRMLWAT